MSLPDSFTSPVFSRWALHILLSHWLLTSPSLNTWRLKSGGLNATTPAPSCRCGRSAAGSKAGCRFHNRRGFIAKKLWSSDGNAQHSCCLIHSMSQIMEPCVLKSSCITTEDWTKARGLFLTVMMSKTHTRAAVGRVRERVPERRARTLVFRWKSMIWCLLTCGVT